MDALRQDIAKALDQLGKARRRLTRQQFKTLRGQILAGDPSGALRGLQKLLNTEGGREHDRPI